MSKRKGEENPEARQAAADASDNYWQWDRCRWGTHRVNCYPGSCPFRVYAKNGEVIREEISCTYPEFSDPDYKVPDYNPRGCQKGYQHSKAMYGPDRLLYPMKRAGERGSGKWERISWEQACDEIAGKLADIIQKYGPQAISDDHGTNGAGVLRGGGEGASTGFVSRLGGVSYDLNFLIGDFNPGQYLTFGQFQHAPGIETWFLADTVIALSNPAYGNIPDIHYILEARYRGAKVVAIAPDKNATAQFADMWLPVNWSADPALWLGVCKILIDNGWLDLEFMKEQTDLPVLVRMDNQQFLRASDLTEGADMEQFFAIDSATGKPEPLPKGTLAMPFDYALEGNWKVTLKDKKQVEVTTVFELLKKRVAEYTPEKVHEISGIHPDQLAQLAELVKPPRKVFVFVNWNAGKLYHGDLLERSYCYMLALTGNVGKAGTGSRGWSAGAEYIGGAAVVGGMPNEVLETGDPLLHAMNMSQKIQEDYRTYFKMDPTIPPAEASLGALREGLRMGGTLAPPVWLWYHHAGYKEVWDKFLDDPNAPKKISEYAEESLANGWWKGFVHPAKDVTPKGMLVSGSNPLRRHRGGMNTYLKTLWPKLELIVVLDPRWSTTGLYADYALPAASFYEYADAKYSTPATRFSTFTDQTVPMLGESRSDRQITLALLQRIQEHLLKRGIEKYKSGDREIVVKELYWRATFGGRYGQTNEDEEMLVNDTYNALGKMGWFESLDGEELTLDNLRKNGKAWLSGRPAWHATVVQNADIVPGQIFWPFRDQIEQKVPYATTTRRMELYLDHPWFIEADEHLVRYKQPPNIGGAQPLRLTSGHLRWSVHSNWVVSYEMLKLHRGEPFAFINDTVAKEKGIADHDYIRVYNDYGSFITRAKLSSCTRPDQLVIYHAWEPYQYPNWMPYDGLLPGPPKGLHFAGGYRHYEYTLWNWAPSQSDRQTNIDFEKANLQA
ncbi:molybdopterin-dependent oxidoreductase [Candidatus Binatus sp.]|jgi:DMSO reductase family type II enzyme molybdopterin subunit|uniref:molybdopterin-dependent oxidoreductase n=1 Tax=Candidatus Binatus sp. TaxID=2811406 RepID=UPI003BDD0CBA